MQVENQYCKFVLLKSNWILGILKSEIIKSIYNSQKENNLFGKWIVFADIQKLFEKHQEKFEISKIGE